jgi:hypothetical protein
LVLLLFSAIGAVAVFLFGVRVGMALGYRGERRQRAKLLAEGAERRNREQETGK